jgi:hypothetical protein
MDTTPLRAFASKARASNRLLYGDLRRLQRDVLPTGAVTREEVEILLALDGMERLDDGWPGYLATTVSEFALSTADPPGVIEGEAAAWLVTSLSGVSAKTAAAVVRAIAADAQHVNEALLSFVRRGAKRPSPSWSDRRMDGDGLSGSWIEDRHGAAPPV